jgi:hypothetical protein
MWGLVFRTRQYLRGSLWVFPLLGGVVAGVVGQIGLPLDTGANASIPWQYTPSTASTILATIIGATAA